MGEWGNREDADKGLDFLWEVIPRHMSGQDRHEAMKCVLKIEEHIILLRSLMCNRGYCSLRSKNRHIGEGP